MQWSFGVERELLQGLMLDVAYVLLLIFIIMTTPYTEAKALDYDDLVKQGESAVLQFHYNALQRL